MRVIGGAYRGRRLRAPHGQLVRPTSDRLRETLFNILTPCIEGSRFLDICAGSGAVGIEALSRGASHVTFIDRSRRACLTIEENLEAIKASSQAAVINRDAVAAIRRLAEESAQFDIAFFDPPYASGIYSQVTGLLADGSLLSDEATVIVEHHSKTPPADEHGSLKIYRIVRQGESALAFYRMQ